MDLEQYTEHIKRFEIPPEPPYNLAYSYDTFSSPDMFAARDVCTDHGSWVIIADTWIKCLAEWIDGRKCLEIMAGAGWLAKGLQNHGVDIIATDSYHWNKRHTMMKHLTEVLRYEATRAVKTFTDTEVLIVSWPPYGKRTIVTACNTWNDRGPIVYIGEDDGGCNAPSGFFRHFHLDNTAPDIYLPQWYGLHDEIRIGNWVNRSTNGRRKSGVDEETT